MKIKAVAYRAPSKKVTNEDVINYLDSQNLHLSFLQKNTYLKSVKRLLRQTGAETRHWRDVEAGERAVDLIMAVMDEALAKAKMSANDIDLLIYCGVGRGFLEPANAYFYAKAKGMKSVNCFDVTDACMSWIRALHISYLMLQAGTFKTVMVINGEFNKQAHANWEIRDLKSLEYTFPMYTIGEAATATILVPSENTWQFTYSSRPEYADLCTIPLEDYANFIEAGEKINLNGINHFVSFGKELFEEGGRYLSELIIKYIERVNHNVLYFPHAPSKGIYEELWTQSLKLPIEKLYLQVYPRFGNIVSASIPVGLCLAQSEGKLQEGDPIAFIPASAGVVASVVQLTF